MKIKLVDVDSKIPNLALMKISAYRKEKDDEVGFDIPDPDMIYASVIFTKNAWKARALSFMFPGIPIDIGGSGIDLNKILPSEIERIKPDYDLYPSTYSQGYTTRGCIRKCGFCVVPKKEGKIQIGQHPDQFHDFKFDTCMIMDNNLFAAPQDWQDKIFSWFSENNVKMKSPQGWDARLLTVERASKLYNIKHDGILHFAWDNVEEEKHIFKAINILKEIGFDLKHHVSFYVLCGYNTTFEQDLYRCQKLKEAGVQAFAMRYRRSPELNALARWTIRPQLFWSVEFSDYTRKVKAR